jgi:molecular chaperone HtpG
MKDDQKAIYFINGESEDRLRKSPLLEMYNKENVEVLLCFDELDELVIPMIGKFGELELKSVNRSGAEQEFDSKKDKKKQKSIAPLLEKFKKALGEKVKDVRLSLRLSESPSCVVLDADDPGYQMQMLMKSMGRGSEAETIPILEINGDHALVKQALESEDEDCISDIANVLLDQALLVEGIAIKDPSDFIGRLNRLICKS